MRALTAAALLALAAAACSRAARPAVDVAAVSVVGEPADWSRLQPLLDEPKRLRCLESLPGREAVRLVWEQTPAAEDLDIATGRRSPAPVAPDMFRDGCARLSPGGLMFSSYLRQGRRVIQWAPSETGVGDHLAEGVPLTPLGHGPGLVYTYDGKHVAIVWVTLTAALLTEAPQPVRAALAATPHGSGSHEITVLYEAESGGTLLVDYDQTSRRLTLARRLPPSRLLLWNEPRRRLQLLVDDPSPAWAELSEPGTLRRLGAFPTERLTLAAAVPGGIIFATTPNTAVPSTRLRFVRDKSR